jgi:transcriptional regulator with XRE-family HTH domain
VTAPRDKLVQQLTRIREANGISGEQLATAVGCQPGTLHRWETGQYSPSLSGAVRWANALGMHLHCTPASRHP